MKILVIGFDVDVLGVENLFKNTPYDIYLKSIPMIPEGHEDVTHLSDIPNPLDMILYLASSNTPKTSSRIATYYGMIYSNFEASESYSLLLHSFDETKHWPMNNLPQINLKELKNKLYEHQD